MNTRAWLDQAIACFDDPDDNGEDTAWEVRGQLEALRDEAPRDAGPEHRAILEVLIAEADGLADGPYTRARLSDDDPPRLELFHHPLDAWIPASERDARRAATRSVTRSPGAPSAWQTFAAGAAPSSIARLERTFEKRTGGHLTHEVTRRIEEGELALAEDIARAVLAQRPRFPGHWWNLLGEAQLARDPASARPTVARALLFAETWMPSAVSLWFRVEEACGAEADTLAVIYVGGRAHGFGLDKPPAQGGLGWRRVGKPARAKARFAEAMVPLLAEGWRAGPIEGASALRSLAGTLEGFGKAAPKTLREQVASALAEAEARGEDEADEDDDG